MKRTFVLLFAILLAASTLHAAVDSLNYGRFGTVKVYYQKPRPNNVVLFISGDGGWNQGVVSMAQELTKLDAMVVGINIIHYLKELDSSSEACSYPAGDLELLSQFIQHHYDYPEYVSPILVGYSSGATLIYAALAQAPSQTFKGGISLGFGPDMEVTKPFCKGDGLEYTKNPKAKGYLFLPAKHLAVPWIALQGEIDQVVTPAVTEEYTKEVPNAQVVMLPKVGHGYSVPRNWMPQFEAAFEKVAATRTDTLPPPQAAEVRDLPLVEAPSADTTGKLLAVHITGDGGYGVTDKGIATTLADSGISTVVLNAQKYFWKAKTPEQSSQALARILGHYLNAWNKQQAVLIGYSLGADALPFMVNRLPEDLKSRIKEVALIGPSRSSDFRVHVLNIIGGSTTSSNAAPVAPELEKMKGMDILIFHSAGDEDTPIKDLPPGLVKVIELPGGHRVKSNFHPITDEIVKEAKK